MMMGERIRQGNSSIYFWGFVHDKHDGIETNHTNAIYLLSIMTDRERDIHELSIKGGKLRQQVESEARGRINR